MKFRIAWPCPGPVLASLDRSQSERGVNDAPLQAGRHREAASLEHLQHRHILSQHLGNEFLERGCACDPDQMDDEMAGNAPFLVWANAISAQPGRQTTYLEPPTIISRPPSVSTATSAT